MPLYEYQCSACESQFEVLVRSAGSDPHPACPDCGATRVRRLVSLVAARPARSGESISPAAWPAPPAGGGCCGGACGCGH